MVAGTDLSLGWQLVVRVISLTLWVVMVEYTSMCARVGFVYSHYSNSWNAILRD